MMWKSLAAVLPFTLIGASAWADEICGSGDGLTSYSIYAYGINATFIGYGARLTSLYVHDKNNQPRDVVVGYDNPAQYIKDTETNHTYFGAVVGRYANRIKNGTFQINDNTYQIPENENGGKDTLHGGTEGYDARNWTLIYHNTSSVTFSLLDPDGFQGFPGAVLTTVTYSVFGSPSRLYTSINSVALSIPTPIMLANHIYWNLGAFTSATILNDTLWMPYSDRIIDIDSIEVPTGGLTSVQYPWQNPPVPLNFTSPKPIGQGTTSQNCGYGCTGIDNAFIIDRPATAAPESTVPTVLQWSSADTGIRLSLRTNQQSLQLYSCNGQNGTIPIKADQMGGATGYVEKYGCLVIETQQWIDGINNYQWGLDQLDHQIFGPNTLPAINWAEYTFDTV